MNRKYLTIEEVRQILEKISRERELNTLQKNILRHAEDFSKVKQKDVKKLREKLLKIDILNEKYATKLIDLMPRTPDEVRVIFAREKTIPTPEDIQKILKALYENNEGE